MPVKTSEQLGAVDALVVPGGESTTVMKLLARFGLDGPIVQRVRAGMPFWGTCMGLIVAAHDVAGLDQPTLDLIDVTVRRNAFGRQIESAEVPLAVPALGPEPFPAIFIRAPWVERAGPGVEILAERDGHPVFVRSGSVWARRSTPSSPATPGSTTTSPAWRARAKAGRPSREPPALKVQVRDLGLVGEGDGARDRVEAGVARQVAHRHAGLDPAEPCDDLARVARTLGEGGLGTSAQGG